MNTSVAPIVVAGLTNIETSAPVEAFPLPYAKVRFVFGGVGDRVGGVGFNVAAMLGHLGAKVWLASLLGDDLLADVVISRYRDMTNVDASGVLKLLSGTPRSVNLVAANGEAAFLTDLKESQEIAYPRATAEALLDGAALLHATNINWALGLADIARERGIAVSTDVHAIDRFDDDYNARFLRRADIVFFSAERLPMGMRDAAEALWRATDASLAVIGMGADGATVADRRTGRIIHQPATPLRPVRNATGCGDALAAGFLAAHVRGFDAEECLRRGQRAAGWKIGAAPGELGLPPRDVYEGA